MKYTLPGSFAVLLLGLLIVAGRAHLAYATVDTQAAEHLKRWIAAEYTSYQLNRDDLELEEKAAMMEHIRGLEFEAIDAVGPPDNMVFRVKLKPNPAQPPSAKLLRYFRQQHSLLTGWSSPPRNVDALFYYLAMVGL